MKCRPIGDCWTRYQVVTPLYSCAGVLYRSSKSASYKYDDTRRDIVRFLYMMNPNISMSFPLRSLVMYHGFRGCGGKLLLLLKCLCFGGRAAAAESSRE